MAVQNEIWVRYIMDRLYKDNAFLTKCFSDDQYVIGGRVVHIPQPGAAPTVVKNRSSFPGVAVQRTDTDILYSLDSYTTDPTHITNAEMQEITYDKIGSVFGDHAGYLVQTVADDLIIKWLTGLGSGSIIATSGAATAGSNWDPTLTGNRKAMISGDLKKAALKMNLQNIPKQNRFALLESNMLDQLTSDLTQTQYRDFSQYFDGTNNIVGKLYGFNIMERSAVAYSAVTTNAINPLGASLQATDQPVSFVWQQDAVARALGERKFFERKDDPLYYGDVYSALLRMGGRRRRANDAGIFAIMAQ
jgi:hypothetical protein